MNQEQEYLRFNAELDEFLKGKRVFSEKFAGELEIAGRLSNADFCRQSKIRSVLRARLLEKEQNLSAERAGELFSFSRVPRLRATAALMAAAAIVLTLVMPGNRLFKRSRTDSPASEIQSAGRPADPRMISRGKPAKKEFPGRDRLVKSIPPVPELSIPETAGDLIISRKIPNPEQLIAEKTPPFEFMTIRGKWIQTKEGKLIVWKNKQISYALETTTVKITDIFKTTTY